MSSGERKVSFVMQGEKAGRLDQIICRNLESSGGGEGHWTRSQVKHWIESGRVLVGGAAEKKAGTLVRPGMLIEFSIPPETTELAPYEFLLDIVHEDDEILVINKPAGILMHPGAGNRDKTIANAIVAHCSREKEGLPFKGIRPGIVHRLDKDTTGLVVIAKTLQAHAVLSRQFATREASRTYLALVLSTPRAKRATDTSESGVIDAPIGRHATKRRLFTVVETGGKRAVTRWKALERMIYASLLEVRIDTGRTHQIRVHMSHVGSPVIGDQVYGDFSSLPASLKAAAAAFGRQALHAAGLRFVHPASGEAIDFSCPPPADFLELLERFRK